MNLKKIIRLGVYLFAINFLLLSCSSNDDDNMETEAIDINYSLKGTFISSAHPTSGIATVNKEKSMIELKEFKTDSGPALNIYLASDLTKITTDYIDLGIIKGINGNYNYDLPTNIDYAKYKYVVVWCVDFDVNFGYATLTSQM